MLNLIQHLKILPLSSIFVKILKLVQDDKMGTEMTTLNYEFISPD